MLKHTYPEGYRDQVIFISGLYANLGSDTYAYHINLIRYEGIVGLLGHGGARDNWYTCADIT